MLGFSGVSGIILKYNSKRQFPTEIAFLGSGIQQHGRYDEPTTQANGSF